MNTRLLIVHALSPLHAGTGQSLGAVDLAIARDRATDLPYLPGSSLKGSLRDASRSERHEGRDADERDPKRKKDRGLTLELFGPETDSASEYRGGALFGDANLLLLPVRSIAGTFAWATSPYLLNRFARDLKDLNPKRTDVPAAPAAVTVSTVEKCIVGPRTQLKVGEKVIFEDLDFTPEKDNAAEPWARLLREAIFPNDPVWQGFLDQRLCIVHDDVMSFLARHGTAVVARVALEIETKTVRPGGLWHEESLPPETILHSLVHVDPVPGKGTPEALLGHLEALTHEKTIQLGGKATVGRGRCRLVLGGA